MIGCFDSKRAEAGCTIFQESESPIVQMKKVRKQVKELRNARRARARALRRAEGIVISSVSAQVTPEEIAASYTNVHLRGLGALQRVFPDLSRKLLVDSLRELDDVPAAERSAVAARKVIALKLQEPVYGYDLRLRSAPDSLEIDHVTGLQRACSVIFNTNHDSKISSAKDDDLLGPPVLTRVVSVPCLIMDSCRNPLDPEDELEVTATPTVAHTQGHKDDAAVEDFDESLEEERVLQLEDCVAPCSHRAWKRDRKQKTARGSKKDRRDRVNSPLLEAPIPCDEVMMALVLAKEEAALIACDSFTEQAEQKYPLSTWKNLQQEFIKNNARAILDELGPSASLKPLTPDASVQDQFLNCCRTVGSMPLPAYHGTKQRNLASISQNGLIIPGHRGVHVANGSAHGIGIYTAHLGASRLSAGFCDSPNMFVCAVSDGPKQPIHLEDDNMNRTQRWISGHRQTRPASSRNVVVQSHMMGRLKVKKESAAVRHVGNAMVVFDESHVAPLFLASGLDFNMFKHNRAWNQTSFMQNLWPAHGNPNRRSEMSATRQIPIPELDLIVWQPPEAETCRYAINVKRRIVGKEKDMRRRDERKQKTSWMCD